MQVNVRCFLCLVLAYLLELQSGRGTLMPVSISIKLGGRSAKGLKHAKIRVCLSAAC